MSSAGRRQLAVDATKDYDGGLANAPAALPWCAAARR